MKAISTTKRSSDDSQQLPTEQAYPRACTVSKERREQAYQLLKARHHKSAEHVQNLINRPFADQSQLVQNARHAVLNRRIRVSVITPTHDAQERALELHGKDDDVAHFGYESELPTTDDSYDLNNRQNRKNITLSPVNSTAFVHPAGDTIYFRDPLNLSENTFNDVLQHEVHHILNYFAPGNINDAYGAWISFLDEFSCYWDQALFRRYSTQSGSAKADVVANCGIALRPEELDNERKQQIVLHMMNSTIYPTLQRAWFDQNFHRQFVTLKQPVVFNPINSIAISNMQDELASPVFNWQRFELACRLLNDDDFSALKKPETAGLWAALIHRALGDSKRAAQAFALLRLPMNTVHNTALSNVKMTPLPVNYGLPDQRPFAEMSQLEIRKLILIPYREGYVETEGPAGERLRSCRTWLATQEQSKTPGSEAASNLELAIQLCHYPEIKQKFAQRWNNTLCQAYDAFALATPDYQRLTRRQALIAIRYFQKEVELREAKTNPGVQAAAICLEQFRNLDLAPLQIELPHG